MRLEIRPTDHVHVGTNDDTCSRCRKSTADEVPLMVWNESGERMWIFCEECSRDVFAKGDGR